MALISSFTARRLADRKPPASKQVITFNLSQEWFAVSTEIAQRVVPIQAVYKDQESPHLPTFYEGKELHLLNLEAYFAEEEHHQEIDIKKGYLILFETSKNTLLALSIPNAPVLRRISESAFVPISLIRTVSRKTQDISLFVIRIEDEPIIFLLDYEHLIQITTLQ